MTRNYEADYVELVGGIDEDAIGERSRAMVALQLRERVLAVGALPVALGVRGHARGLGVRFAVDGEPLGPVCCRKDTPTPALRRRWGHSASAAPESFRRSGRVYYARRSRWCLRLEKFELAREIPVARTNLCGAGCVWRNRRGRSVGAKT